MQSDAAASSRPGSRSAFAEAQPTRRDCLRATAGLAAGWMSHRLCLAAADRPPLEWAMISDTHLGYRDQTAASEQWLRTAEELAKSKATFVLHLGDVVDGQRTAQYAPYLEGRERIGKPVYELPGNHDPVEGFSKNLRQEIDTVIDQQWLRCLLMNNAHADSHDGFFTAEQLDWLEKKCAEAVADDRALLLACHVPVHTNQHPDRGWYVKPADGQQRFYEIAGRHRENIVGIFHGHFHNGLRGWTDHELREVCFPSVLYNQDRKLEEQQAPGFNPQEFRPGYATVTAGEGKLHIRYQPTGAAASVEKAW